MKMKCEYGSAYVVLHIHSERKHLSKLNYPLAFFAWFNSFTYTICDVSLMLGRC